MGDLLECAEKIGYFWNQAHKILFDRDKAYLTRFVDGNFPIQDIINGEYGNIDEDASKILSSFIKNNPTELDYFLAGKS